MFGQLGKKTGGFSADGVAHSGIEFVVDVGEDDVEVGLSAFDDGQFVEPVFLHPLGQGGAEFEEFAN